MAARPQCGIARIGTVDHIQRCCCLSVPGRRAAILLLCTAAWIHPHRILLLARDWYTTWACCPVRLGIHMDQYRMSRQGARGRRWGPCPWLAMKNLSRNGSRRLQSPLKGGCGIVAMSFPSESVTYRVRFEGAVGIPHRGRKAWLEQQIFAARNPQKVPGIALLLVQEWAE